MYGPFSRTTQRKSGTRVIFSKRSYWYRTSGKSYKDPLPYTMYETSASGAWVQHSDNAWAGYYALSGYGSEDQLAKNKAYLKFKDALHEGTSASLAVTLAEWKQSERMIFLRASQLLSSVRKLKRGDIYGAARVLDLNPDTSRRISRTRKTAGAWLEYQLGWVPLISDIHSAVDVMQGSIPTSRISGRGSSTVSISQQKGEYEWSTFASLNTRCECSAIPLLKNPNLALANRLGLLNPASVAWELVPFSFVIDWFAPVGAFLESFSDFIGFEFGGPYTTITRKGAATQNYIQPSGIYTESSQGIACLRSLSLPSYKFVVPPFKGFSVTRAATAISLLIQISPRTLIR